jgi:ribonuclease P protein component
LPHPRVGVIVPRYKHSAVDRNRLKRRLREIIRTALLPAIDAQVDVVVRALPPAYGAPFETLHAQLARTAGAITKVGERKPPRAEPT